MSSVEKLQRLKSTIQKNKEKSDRLKGQLDAVKADLKKAGYKNLKEAKAGLASIRDKQEKLQNKIDTMLQKLEDQVYEQED